MIDILIIDEKRLFSEGIGAFLSKQESMNILGLEKDLGKINHILDNEDPHILLMNLLIADLNILDLTTQIKEKYGCKIIHYSAEADESTIINSISHGADSIVLERVNPNHLVQSIHAIMNGASFFTGEIAQVLVDRIQDFEFDEKVKIQRKLKEQNIHLTQREIDVALLVKKNHGNKEIAQKLHLSEGTVKNYVSDLYRIFNKETRKDLIEHIRKLG